MKSYLPRGFNFIALISRIIISQIKVKSNILMERTFLERKPSKNSIRGVIPDCNKTTGSSTSISY